MKQKLVLVIGMISLITVSCSRNSDRNDIFDKLPNDVILKWNQVAYDAFGGTSYQHSLMAARINAIMHIAMHDALNAIRAKFAVYSFTGREPHADPIAAAASAAHTVLVHEIAGKKNFLDSALQLSLSVVSESIAKEKGVKLGKEAAQAIIDLRSNDGSNGNPVVPVPDDRTPGVYQPVPPFNFYFAPFWEQVKLFGLQRKDQFRCPPPPSLNSLDYATAFNEVKNKGRKNSAERSIDQTAIAKFWYEFSEAGWNRVARIVAIDKKLNLFETARLFALVDMAMSDSYVAGWDSKLHYNLWRPFTAIRNASTDGNEQTTEDMDWVSEEITPPIQDYPSTHSTLGNAAAVVLASITGDATSFTMSSPTALSNDSTRSFTSFSQAARENAESRIMAGIHFRFACDAGLELGSKIGEWIVTHYLQPVK